MRNIFAISENACFGCSACSVACPHGAINMVQSQKGFYIPLLKQEKCVECGLCLKCCPAANAPSIFKQNEWKVRSYAVRHKSDEIRFLSSSGGAFTAIVETYLNRDDCFVYGAAFHDGRICHLRVDVNNIEKLRKSKYVQSDLGDTFFNIFQDLNSKKTVIFCGTPCQCDGLIHYLSLKKCQTDHLITIDFICHGTLAPRVFLEFLTYCEKKHKGTIIDHCFRGKSKGWHSYIGVNTYENGDVDSKSFTSQLFTSLFYTNYSFKEACYTCQYASANRVSDITLGDFWGIEDCLPELDDNKGVSFVMVNTQKGQSIFDKMITVDSIEVPLEYTKQAHLSHPVARPEDNDRFWDYLNKRGFHKMAVKYLKAGKIRRTISKLLRMVLKLVK